MPRLIACPSCNAHVLSSEGTCPHCDATIERRSGGTIAATAAAVLMGLAAPACDKDGPGSEPIEAMYGAPVTDQENPPSAESGDTPSDPGDDDGGGQDSAGEEPMPPDVAEPEYGVPATPDDPPMKPMYGVPET
ncbi:MAG: hypothetical protein AAGA54_04130 [Myxococcota bacterium]